MPEQKQHQNSEQSTNNVELRSEAIQEILGRPPKWIIRWGITLIFTIVLLILVGSAFFRYPDVVTAEVLITSTNPPSWVMARSSGKLQELFVTDKQVVKAGEVLALIDNPALSTDVFTLNDELDSLSSFFYTFDTNTLKNIEFRKLELGELQDMYVSLIKQLRDYERFISLDLYAKKRASMVRELGGQQKYCKLLERQHKLQLQDVALAEKLFQRQTQLFNEKAISALEYENAEQQVLAARRSVEQSNISVSNAEISLEKMEQSIVELDLNYENELRSMQTSLENVYEQLKARVSIWEQQYVMRAPVAGVINFNKVWSINHLVNSGETVFAIIPEEQGELVGKVSILASAGAGKIKVGQSVNIKLDSYPYMEFGMLKGEVTSISLLPAEKDRMYTIELSLPNGLVSFYNQTFDFTGELSGTAEIATDELSVLERFFQPLKHLFNKQGR